MIQIDRSMLAGNNVSADADRRPLVAQRAAPPLRVWGLTAVELHDAFWRSRGVQCVRRGQSSEINRGAELFLLIDHDQMVLFNIALLRDRLMWRDAVLTRIRLVHECNQRYSEHVVLMADGTVDRIERRYRPAMLCSMRVMMTPSVKVAIAWSESQTRREGHRRIRQRVMREYIDSCRGEGELLCADNPNHQQRLLDQLVALWHCPSQTINGLVESEPGVWHLEGEALPSTAIRVGPLWLGRSRGDVAAECLIGPAWRPDTDTIESQSLERVAIRDFADVEPMHSARVDESDTNSIASRSRSHKSTVYPVIKRLIDIAVSATALVTLSPIMALIAAIIWLEDGRPIFFSHKRQGRGGRPFQCWKFRTMQRNAHALVKQLHAFNICDGPQVLIKDDPRVTSIGRLLRKTMLDELPQFWNVLAGDMSLVGPRPSPDDENQYCPAWRDLRLSVRPGITGLWQLNRTRRRGSDFQEWIKYDILYVRNAGFLIDLKIIMQTAWLILYGRRTRGVAKTNQA